VLLLLCLWPTSNALLPLPLLLLALALALCLPIKNAAQTNISISHPPWGPPPCSC
jgi:hypothetical protein